MGTQDQIGGVTETAIRQDITKGYYCPWLGVMCKTKFSATWAQRTKCSSLDDDLS